MGLKRAARDYAAGVTTKGQCAECGHWSRAQVGCQCSSGWCPCHAAAMGHRHGGHSCDCR